MGEVSKLKQVLRCPSCEVRVALECDLVMSRKLTSGVVVGVFNKVVNLLNDGTFASCARCGNDLFPLNLVRGPHELVLLYDMENVFTKTPLRILTITKAVKSYFYKSYVEWHKGDNKYGSSLEIKMKYDERNPGKKALLDIDSIGDLKECDDMEIEQRNVLWLQRGPGDENIADGILEDLSSDGTNFVEKIDLIYNDYDFDTFREQVLLESTYDFILVSQFSRDEALCWSGMRRRAMEEVLVFCWVASGGNMMLAQWGVPFHTVVSGENVNVDMLIESLKKWSTQRNSQNKQDLLMKFMTEGLYLAYWPEHDSMPTYARERVKNAIRSQHNPLWKFRSDLNDVTFETFPMQFFRGSRANEIKDVYPIEEERSEAASEASSFERSFLTYVSKRSHTLYKSSVRVLKAAEESWKKMLNAINAA